MSFADGCAKGYVPPTVSEDTHRAVFFLEARGQRFLIDFGWSNALTLAQAIWRKEGSS